MTQDEKQLEDEAYAQKVHFTQYLDYASKSLAAIQNTVFADDEPFDAETFVDEVCDE